MLNQLNWVGFNQRAYASHRHVLGGSARNSRLSLPFLAKMFFKWRRGARAAPTKGLRNVLRYRGTRGRARTGEWDTFYMALLKMRLINDDQDPDQDLLNPFKEHIERGVILLYNRVKMFQDLADLLWRAREYHIFYCKLNFFKVWVM